MAADRRYIVNSRRLKKSEQRPTLNATGAMPQDGCCSGGFLSAGLPAALAGAAGDGWRWLSPECSPLLLKNIVNRKSAVVSWRCYLLAMLTAPTKKNRKPEPRLLLCNAIRASVTKLSGCHEIIVLSRNYQLASCTPRYACHAMHAQCEMTQHSLQLLTLFGVAGLLTHTHSLQKNVGGSRLSRPISEPACLKYIAACLFVLVFVCIVLAEVLYV